MRLVPFPLSRRPRRACQGLLVVTDLHGCDRQRLADPDTIRGFVPSLAEELGLSARGPLQIERLGAGEVDGWSALQSTDAGCIAVHADAAGGRCYVDVLAFRPFPSTRPAELAARWFGGFARVTVVDRA